jgi:hypothetical protein
MKAKPSARLHKRKPPPWWRKPAKQAFFSLAAAGMLVGGLCARPNHETQRLAEIVRAMQKCENPEEQLYLYQRRFSLGRPRVNWVDSRCYRPEEEARAQKTGLWPPGGKIIYVDSHLTL